MPKDSRDLSSDNRGKAGTFKLFMRTSSSETDIFWEVDFYVKLLILRVIKVIDDDEANLEDTETSGATAEVGAAQLSNAALTRKRLQAACWFGDSTLVRVEYLACDLLV
jgi:hypothetical protein